MSRGNRAVFVGLLSLAACAPVTAPPLEEVLLKAKHEHKPVVLEVYTKWCRNCKTFARQTLSKKNVQKALSDVVFVRYDAERGPGESVAERYKVTSYPSFLVLDASGLLCHQGRGDTAGVRGFIKLLQTAGAATRSLQAVQQQLEAHRSDPEVLLQAARWHVSHHFLPESLALYAEAANLTPGGAAAAAQARWEGNKLRRMLELREQIISDAREQVGRYPGTPSAGKALLIAAVSAAPLQEEVQKLVELHLQMLAEPPPLPVPRTLETEVSQATVTALADAIEIALAGQYFTPALAAAQRLVQARPESIRGRLLLARAYNDSGDRPAALAQLTRAENLATSRPLRSQLRALYRRVQTDGKLPYWPVDGAPQRLVDYFTKLEGGPVPLDGVDAISPLLAPAGTIPGLAAAL